MSGRYRPSKSYGHTIKQLDMVCFRISWTYDRYINGSRLRWPTGVRRDTDRAGALRFAKRHNVPMPGEDK